MSTPERTAAADAGEPAPPRRGGREALARPTRWTAIAAGAALLLPAGISLLGASVPGGLDFGLVLWWLGGLIAGALLLLVVLALAIARRRMAWSLLALPLAFAGAVWLASTPLPQALHWPVIRGALAAADASGECPALAGLAPVAECIELPDGQRAYDFGGGFLGQLAIAHLDDPTAYSPDAAAEGRWAIDEELGDGWYLISLAW